MAIGERIRFFRNIKGMTQKYLGIQMGFPEKNLIFVWRSMKAAQVLRLAKASRKIQKW